MSNKQKEKVTIPKELLRELISSKKKWEENLNKLEDYLVMNNPAVLKKIEEGLKDVNEGNTESFDQVVEDMDL